jgi:hypothetical protein
MAQNKAKSALPEPFYSFFVWIEPLLTFGGALYALALPEKYFDSLVPLHIAPLASLIQPGVTHKAVPMAIHQLGNCSFLVLCCFANYPR